MEGNSNPRGEKSTFEKKNQISALAINIKRINIINNEWGEKLWNLKIV